MATTKVPGDGKLSAKAVANVMSRLKTFVSTASTIKPKDDLDDVRNSVS